MRLKITYKSPTHLKPRINNPRTHTKKQIEQIAASIQEFGFISPVLIDGADGIIAGHARVEAAKLIGMRDVPTVRVDHLTPAQIRAYVIADNRLAEQAGWDRNLLRLELQELSVELNFDVTVTGFETAEIDLLISELNEDTPDDADEVPTIDRSVPAVSRPGDLWRRREESRSCSLSRHRCTAENDRQCAGCRRDSGLLQARRNHSRRLRREWYDPDRSRKGRTAGLRH